MSLQDAQQGVSDITDFFGTALLYGGGACLITMGVVSTVSIDLVFLKFAEKQRNPFITGFLWGLIFSGNNKNDPKDVLMLLIISPFTAAVAVALSVLLGVPEVGAFLVMGWAAASLITAAGWALKSIAASIAPEDNSENNYASSGQSFFPPPPPTAPPSSDCCSQSYYSGFA